MPPAAPARQPVKCSTFLVGNWAGQGTVTEFGPPVRTESTMRYGADGTFDSAIRYLGQNKKWTEQKMTGRWTAATGRSKASCAISLKSVMASGESSSTSEIQVIDQDRYRAFGVELKRVR